MLGVHTTTVKRNRRQFGQALAASFLKSFSNLAIGDGRPLNRRSCAFEGSQELCAIRPRKMLKRENVDAPKGGRLMIRRGTSNALGNLRSNIP
ncbi:hypothetical protein D0Z70_20585 [Sphingobium terrigena]|uniref:Uncharacterized protein n=1 Tax=Sphingobium terrigena TaxID=2304063 RepID=A0A418YMJ2_9SPHN|nr:hypothetical protein D0Z70_20585 [Sphingobium terrigena]